MDHAITRTKHVLSLSTPLISISSNVVLELMSAGGAVPYDGNVIKPRTRIEPKDLPEAWTTTKANVEKAHAVVPQEFRDEFKALKATNLYGVKATMYPVG